MFEQNVHPPPWLKYQASQNVVFTIISESDSAICKDKLSGYSYLQAEIEHGKCFYSEKYF